jgi:Ca2+-binding EF-hand superfamily protein
MLDVDQDGYLRRADFEAIATRLSSGASNSGMQIVRNAYLNFWENLARHLKVPDDGQISRDQYASGLHAIAKTSPTGFDDGIAQMPRAILALYDADRDGQLSSKEFLDFQAALGVPEERARIALLAIDRDADGFITAEDLMNAVREFILSDDPHAPGNWLFGGLKPRQIRYY